MIEITYKERCKLILTVCKALLKEGTKVLYACCSNNDKEKSYKLLCSWLPQSEISSNSDYTIKFKNGSSVQCVKSDELKTVRGNIAKLNPYHDPYEFCLDNKMLEEILNPFVNKLTWWQKLRMRFALNRKYVSSKRWWKR